MATLGTLLCRLGVDMPNYNRLQGRPGAGEGRKRSFVFTQPGQQLGTEVAH